MTLNCNSRQSSPRKPNTPMLSTRSPSLPSTIFAPPSPMYGATPNDMGTTTSTDSTSPTSNKPSTSSSSSFFKTVLIPLALALLLYLTLFHFLLPLYRRHRQRYSQYLPLPLQSSLNSTVPNLTSRLPTALQPSTLREHITHLLSRVFAPAVLQSNCFRTGFGGARRDSAVDVASDVDADALFDEESGERMVGFDVEDQAGGRRRDGMDGALVAQARLAQRPGAAPSGLMRDGAGGVDEDVEDSSRRLSRELEEGFRDDSGSEREEEEVTVGRGRMGRSAWDRLRTGYT